MALQRIRIGDLSRRTGCNIETIRYYERIGLIPVPERSGRYRSYDRDDVTRLGFVRRARQLGFTLEQVRTLLELAARPPSACAEAHEIAAMHLADVRRRIADLARMERILATSVSACAAGSQPGCPVLEALSAPSPLMPQP